MLVWGGGDIVAGCEYMGDTRGSRVVYGAANVLDMCVG